MDDWLRFGRVWRVTARQTLARNIRELREALGLSQEALGLRCDMSMGRISNYEANKHVPSVDAIERIARALGVSVARLFEDAPAPAAAKDAKPARRSPPKRRR